MRLEDSRNLMFQSALTYDKGAISDLEKTGGDRSVSIGSSYFLLNEGYYTTNLTGSVTLLKRESYLHITYVSLSVRNAHSCERAGAV